MKKLRKGCYILFIRFKKEILIKIGALGTHQILKGVYAYVGSAKGPGGLEARVGRHFKKNKRVKWHIDYLTVRPECFLEGVVMIESETLKERELVELLENIGGTHTIKGFGNSDDKSTVSHLLYFGNIGLEEICKGLKKHIKEKMTIINFTKRQTLKI